MSPMKTKRPIILFAVLTTAWVVRAASDIPVADFEQATYGAWKVEGNAFGAGPARGTLPGQMKVGGFRGERLANSFFNGDGSTGTLTSPPFKLERDYLVFLIGGGGFAGKTCMNLLADGGVVRTATGPNTQPGGTEELEPAFWEVREFKGRMVTLQIVDQATGGWGHINVDDIVQSDTKPALPEFGPRSTSFTVERRRLILPIKNGAKQTELMVEVGGRRERQYQVELATRPDDVDWYAFFDLDAFRGQTATVRATRATAEGFALVRQSDDVPGSERWYSESLRPQFHFSQAVGWNNDPNGMVYLAGEWHLFFQHNPVGWNWGNMTWGHAISRDLVHWEQRPEALFPKTMLVGDAFSGGGTVDFKNTAGWKTGTDDVLVVSFTDTGAGESLAYSNDRGRTMTSYPGNPVVKHRGRDPRIIWYPYRNGDVPLNEKAKTLGGHWVMAVYDEPEHEPRGIAFHTSTDLKVWQQQSRLPGYFECPEIFPLPVDGDASRKRWVVFAGDAKYAVGTFDGRKFSPDHDGREQVHWGPYYASQTFANAPGGRRIQIGWVQIAMPGMPFNQTFSFPEELSLHATADGVRLFAKPVEELALIHRKRFAAPAQRLNPGTPVALKAEGELFDIRAVFEAGDARQFGLNIGGDRITYDAVEQRLGDAPLKPVDGRITLQVLVDRPMIEICGNDGRVSVTAARSHHGAVSAIEAFAEGGTARLVSLEAFELESIWK
jgi:fructan beta-fructosidase